MYKLEVRYFQNGLDVTFFVMNELKMPMSERFFDIIPVEVRNYLV